MPGPDARLDRQLTGYAADVRDTLGAHLVSIVLYGSAAGEDFVAARSDVNTAIVVRAVSTAVLGALASLMPTWRRRGFALPLVVDEEFFERAQDVFPMELDDMRRSHRTLFGPDPLDGLAVDRAQLRRQCEHEARGKLLRLRALYLDAAARTQDLERLLVESAKTFLVILRHVIHLRGDEAPHGYADVLAAGERFLGPLPALHRVLAHRSGRTRLGRAEVREEFARYLGDAERIAAAVDTLHA